ncbi:MULTISPECIES: hypothetical protein [unclassified Herbaspirillum]|uniref:SpaN/EivJ family type III secretion system needle length determinant n=1 Tax=unclassified Herbaspirillum TaxID=2624150 RepID=UPI0011518317|nr:MULTISPECIES: hypothetical protein [unclassified Herbaspirillum]MBB5390573.1 hypothetical protein [Herbaspirillum sp. SJZ102]TQK08939.1 hypothetical protein FB599_1296 [Herbaspirillum sp. SJZ130]TQK14374.1 hypothetical protein FB598_1746 [Herbaspirillum sp. SJZ106]
MVMAPIRIAHIQPMQDAGRLDEGLRDLHGRLADKRDRRDEHMHEHDEVREVLAQYGQWIWGMPENRPPLTPLAQPTRENGSIDALAAMPEEGGQGTHGSAQDGGARILSGSKNPRPLAPLTPLARSAKADEGIGALVAMPEEGGQGTRGSVQDGGARILSGSKNPRPLAPLTPLARSAKADGGIGALVALPEEGTRGTRGSAPARAGATSASLVAHGVLSGPENPPSLASGAQLAKANDSVGALAAVPVQVAPDKKSAEGGADRPDAAQHMVATRKRAMGVAGEAAPAVHAMPAAARDASHGAAAPAATAQQARAGLATGTRHVAEPAAPARQEWTYSFRSWGQQHTVSVTAGTGQTGSVQMANAPLLLHPGSALVEQRLGAHVDTAGTPGPWLVQEREQGEHGHDRRHGRHASQDEEAQ